ncbi:MAG: hypothetical protein DLM64_01405 [Solirubrobacterales bacterium]|nr:MAG: hypothetical protein DLM64_01405 [Solirubrobacterales bacterium]
MPHIIVTTGGAKTKGREQDAVTLRERVSVSDFESDHFAARLVERLGWAVSDAHEAEQDGAAR